MMRALFTAATGMKTQQFFTDITSNNLSNVNTHGFKKARPNFQDLVYQYIKEAGSPVLQGSQNPTGVSVGLGVKPEATEKLFMQGSLQQTDNPLDVAILDPSGSNGGFFQVRRQDGSIAYSRDGSFKLDRDGNVVTASGFFLEPQVTVPQDTIQVDISIDGVISVLLPGQPDLQQIGQLELVKFINPGGLKNLGGNLLGETVASGPPQVGQPGQNGFGTAQQGFLETSNVQIVDEMVHLILAQRAFEADSRAVQTSDEMLGIANQLKR